MILLLSPHSDDLALSVGSRLSSSRGWRGMPKTAVTVFVESVHAPYADVQGEREITRLRQREEQDFARAAGAGLIQLPWKEAWLRGYPSRESLFAVDDPRRDPLYQEVRASLRTVLASRPWAAVVAPLGIGRHVEHLIVRDACRELGARPLLLYEDLPYAADFGNDELDRAAAFDGVPRRASFLADPRAWAGKQRLLDLYRSQISARELDRLGVYARFRAVRPDRVRSGAAAAGPAEILWATDEDWELYSSFCDDQGCGGATC